MFAKTEHLAIRWPPVQHDVRRNDSLVEQDGSIGRHNTFAPFRFLAAKLVAFHSRVHRFLTAAPAMAPTPMFSVHDGL